jgi:hypothetical protein
MTVGRCRTLYLSLKKREALETQSASAEDVPFISPSFWQEHTENYLSYA